MSHGRVFGPIAVWRKLWHTGPIVVWRNSWNTGPIAVLRKSWHIGPIAVWRMSWHIGPIAVRQNYEHHRLTLLAVLAQITRVRVPGPAIPTRYTYYSIHKTVSIIPIYYASLGIRDGETELTSPS